MSEKYSLEELIKFRDKLKKDLADYEQELQIVKASVEHPKQTNFLKRLRDQTQVPNMVKQLLEPKTKKRKLISDERATLFKYYPRITEIYIDRATVEFLSIDNEDKCYLYKVEGIVKYLKFNLSYHSNKASHETKENEVISELKINIEQNESLQKEIQQGLDFYYKNPSNIQQAMLFLKDVAELNVIRGKILERVLPQYERFLTVAFSNVTGKLLLKFEGQVNKKTKLFLGWQIKFNPVNYLAVDDIELQSNIKNSQNLNKFEKQIRDYKLWTSYDLDTKISKIQNVIDAFLTKKSEVVDQDIEWKIY